jgi:sporulation protein YlmC with PRC-barrel domain
MDRRHWNSTTLAAFSARDDLIPQSLEDANMAKLTTTAVLLALATTVAGAQAQQQSAQHQAGPAAQILPSVPGSSNTVTNWYKQDVYDPSDNKIGEIMDVLVDREGKVTALIVGVGGFLGAGEKDVAVPFNAVRVTNKNSNNSNKWYLVMNSSKDALKNAKGFKYDRNAMTWVPEGVPATTGSPNNR